MLGCLGTFPVSIRSLDHSFSTGWKSNIQGQRDRMFVQKLMHSLLLVAKSCGCVAFEYSADY